MFRQCTTHHPVRKFHVDWNINRPLAIGTGSGPIRTLFHGNRASCIFKLKQILRSCTKKLNVCDKGFYNAPLVQTDLDEVALNAPSTSATFCKLEKNKCQWLIYCRIAAICKSFSRMILVRIVAWVSRCYWKHKKYFGCVPAPFS
jgi:hypothetical protein